MHLTDRMKAPTPPFFKKLRKIGILLTAVSAAIITAPVSLPAVLVTVAGYTAVAGTIVSAVSQLTTESDSARLQNKSGKGG